MEYPTPTCSAQPSVDDSVKAVEKILSYSFANKSLLKDALTHDSFMKYRLEFLGEKALGLAFTNYLYFAHPNLEPMGLNLLRSTNISNNKFARVAVNHGLYQFLLRDNHSRGFDAKVKLFSESVSREDGPVPYGSGVRTTPRILSALVESVAGAVYIDVNFNAQRLWEICKGLFEPIYTLDDLRRQPQPLLTLIRLGDKHRKQIDFKYRESSKKCYVYEVYLDDELIAHGRSKCRDNAKLLAAKAALLKLSESMPIEMVIDEGSVDIEIEDAKEKLIELCKNRQWPEPIYSVEAEDPENGFVCSAKIETPTEEGTLFIKGDAKKKRERAENNSASHMIKALGFSLPQPLLTLIHWGDKHGKQIDLKYCKRSKNGFIYGVYLDDELIARGQSKCRDYAKLLAAKAALLKVSESMPIDEGSVDIEIEDAKKRLIEFCKKRKWAEPIYSVVAQDPVKGFVCSAKIETPTEEGTLFIKGDVKKKKKLAENNSASHMLKALKFSIKDDLQS